MAISSLVILEYQYIGQNDKMHCDFYTFFFLSCSQNKELILFNKMNKEK
jgi:hypothetical protein